MSRSRICSFASSIPITSASRTFGRVASFTCATAALPGCDRTRPAATGTASAVKSRRMAATKTSPAAAANTSFSIFGIPAEPKRASRWRTKPTTAASASV